MSDCIFCSSLEERGGIIASCGAFNIVVDRAPITDGHILITPKKHIKSFSLLSKKDLLLVNVIITHCKLIMKKIYKKNNFVIAEHGMKENSKVRMCGIDHAHIHIIPISTNVDKSSLTLFEKNLIHELPELTNFRDRDYFFLKFDNEDINLYLSSKFPPQLFRQIIYITLDLEEYDWQEMIDNPRATKNTKNLRKHFLDYGISNDNYFS